MKERRKSLINLIGKESNQTQSINNQQQLLIINNFANNSHKLKPFDFNIVGKNGWTPIHFAVFTNNLIAVELLLSAQEEENINIFARDNEGKYPQELCPFNSAIYKMIRKRQSRIIYEKSQSQQQLTTTQKVVEFNDKANRQIQHNHLNHFYMRRRLRGHKQLQKAQSIHNLLTSYVQNGVQLLSLPQYIKNINLDSQNDENPYRPNTNINYQLKRANSNGMLLMHGQFERLDEHL